MTDTVQNRPIDPLEYEGLDEVLRWAIGEDLQTGDVTTDVLVPPESRARGRLLVKQEGVLAGLDLFARIFLLIDPRARVELLKEDGDFVRPGDVAAIVDGLAHALLVGERTALNFVQRLSGIATRTAQFVALIDGRAKLYDTRKTTPGLRALEKYAVRCGGGYNHRFGLFDEVMVKDNHVALARGRSLAEMLLALRTTHGEEMTIHSEARTEHEALEALAGDADVVLLDNFTPRELAQLVPRMRAAAAKRSRPFALEASGGIGLETVSDYAATGVDRLSCGAVTHSAPALDLAFDFQEVR
ncbi:MAG: carboxylating nicotinate-nucleotide diphosphorylase [Planctomycetota bacterium]